VACAERSQIAGPAIIPARSVVLAVIPVLPTFLFPLQQSADICVVLDYDQQSN
jgi:hypothetical protein